MEDLTSGENCSAGGAMALASATTTPRSSVLLDKSDFDTYRSNPSLHKLGPAPLPSVLSQKTLGSTKLEDRICMEHLKQLMKIFILADEDGNRGLDVDEFKKTIGKILKGKKLNEHEMAILHMKIDSDSDGSIDWDEFCTFMLLRYQEQDTMVFEKKPPFPFPIKKYTSPHRHCIYRITMLPNVSRSFEAKTEGGDNEYSIISISKDGIVGFWKRKPNNLKLYRTVNITKLEKMIRQRPLWVTDMVVMANVHKVLLSFTDSVLAIYDLTTPTFERVFHITRMPHCVVAMDYWYDNNDFDHAILVLGDSGGGICVMEFYRATRCLFGHFGTSKGECIRIAFPNLLIHKVENMRTMYLPEVHKDWVSKICYWPNIEGILSCSCDSDTALVFHTLQGNKESVFYVRKGINSFDYSSEFNLIVTGGMDQRIRLWNPYTVTKPSYELIGHNSTIIFISVNDKTGHLISFSKDMEARVWGIHNQRCLQVCHQFQELDNIPSAFYYHTATSTFVTGYLEVGLLEGYREDLKSVAVVSHEHPLCSALYNPVFNQVVSGCNGSVVSVWDIETGQKAIQFSHCHGDMEITAMAFDGSKRRLVTGGRDGSIKIWNFNNGACLKVLKNSYNAEVICFALFHNYVLASGWSQVIAEYRDLSSKDPIDLMPSYWGKNVHEDDVLSMAYHDPGIIVTSSFDGDIIMWDVMTEQVIAIVNATDVDFSTQYARFYTKMTRVQTDAHMEKEERHLKKASVSNNKQNNLKNIGESKKPRFGYGTNNAVEKVIFLEGREKSLQTATLVACGAGGLVQFWNIYGGGLIGEFNVFHLMCTSEEEREAMHTMHSVTACKAWSDYSLLITGTSLGYIQVWDISCFCIDVPNESKPIQEMPPNVSSWRGHTDTVISIDTAEHKELIVSASLDCCISLWTICGRYVGTFGENYIWSLHENPDDMPLRVPTRLQKIASTTTLQTIAPRILSTFSLLFLSLAEKELEKEFEKELASCKANEKSITTPIEEILKTCKNPRKKPFPSIKLRVRNSDYGLSVYSYLKCPELQPDTVYPHPHYTSNSKRHKKSEKTSSSNKTLPRKVITEKTLFSGITTT